MKAMRTILSSGSRLTLILGCLRAVVQGHGVEPAGVLHPVVSTNHVLVTNVVLVTVTNYVVTRREVLVTNAPDAQVTRSSRHSRPAVILPDLGWVPPADSFDWIQLKSGEWLKGRIKAMQERELEFESEELDDLDFHWKDIRQVRTHRTVDVLFVNGEELTGPVIITPTQITVMGESPQVFDRTEVQSLTPSGIRELDLWTGNLAFGLALRAGNTRQIDFNGQAHFQRRTPATRFTLDYIGNISSVDGSESANNHRASSEFDLWVSRRVYLILPFAEYYKDPFQNLKHRVTTGVGVGYDLIVVPKVEWNIMTGPAYQQAWFESSQPGQPTAKGTGALVFGSRFDWDITRRIELILEYRGQYTSREVGETTHHSVNTLSLELTKRFDLDVSFIWDRIAQPKIGADGTRPKPDDFRLVVGVGWNF